MSTILYVNHQIVHPPHQHSSISFLVNEQNSTSCRLFIHPSTHPSLMTFSATCPTAYELTDSKSLLFYDKESVKILFTLPENGARYKYHEDPVVNNNINKKN